MQSVVVVGGGLAGLAAAQRLADAGAHVIILEARDRGIPVPQVMIDKTLMVMDTHAASIKAAIAAGVRIAMGTDSGVVPHGQNLRELDLMIDCGMSATDALVATTRTAAELMGLGEELGTLEPGKRADVVVVQGDAIDGLSGRVRSVWKNSSRPGRGVSPAHSTPSMSMMAARIACRLVMGDPSGSCMRRDP